MATKEKTTKTTKGKPADMPEGFVELTASRVAGWFVRRAGNTIQGLIKDSFETKGTGKFNRGQTRKVYKIEITNGTTTVMNADGQEVEAGEGELVGVDETGYLKKLADLDKGREVFLACKGKESEAKEAPWIFAIGVVPF
jgi:hypothetical protein